MSRSMSKRKEIGSGIEWMGGILKLGEIYVFTASPCIRHIWWILDAAKMDNESFTKKIEKETCLSLLVKHELDTNEVTYTY